MRVNYTSRSEKVWRTVWITQNDFCLASKKVSWFHRTIIWVYDLRLAGIFHEFTLIYTNEERPAPASALTVKWARKLS
jgi:hypothetical protein